MKRHTPVDLFFYFLIEKTWNQRKNRNWKASCSWLIGYQTPACSPAVSPVSLWFQWILHVSLILNFVIKKKEITISFSVTGDICFVFSFRNYFGQIWRSLSVTEGLLGLPHSVPEQNYSIKKGTECCSLRESSNSF